jgi:hypothetical protein
VEFHPDTSRLPVLFRAVPAFLSLVLVAVAGACTRAGGEGERIVPPPPESLSERCESALHATTAATIRPLAFPLIARWRIGDERQHPLGRVVGARSLDEGHIAVLDGLNSRVTIYDTLGSVVASFGRQGNGPGEFEELGFGHGSRAVYNQLAVTPAGWIAVNELNLLHIFRSDGTFVERMTTGGAHAGPHGVRHLAPVSDSSFLFARTGAMEVGSDSTSRAALSLYEVVVRGTTLDTVYVGRLDNTLVRFRPPDPFPARDPYAGMYRRTWDALPDGILVAASLRQHGICFFDAERAVTGAYRVAAPVLPVDGAEKRRVIAALRSRHGDAPPLRGGGWDDFYSEWPSTLPYYTDLVMASDSVVWVERPVTATEWKADLYHVRRGYLGSTQVPSARLPVAFHGRCALFEVEYDRSDEGDLFYGLKTWCPGS